MTEQCACIRGYHLCPEAVRLWNQVGIWYVESSAAEFTGESLARYEKAQEDYRAHFGTEDAHGTMPLR